MSDTCLLSDNDQQTSTAFGSAFTRIENAQEIGTACPTQSGVLASVYNACSQLEPLQHMQYAFPQDIAFTEKTGTVSRLVSQMKTRPHDCRQAKS